MGLRNVLVINLRPLLSVKTFRKQETVRLHFSCKSNVMMNSVNLLTNLIISS